MGGFGSVGMPGIEHLVFEAEVGVAVFGDAVFDAAVALFGDFPVPAEFEIAIFLGGVEVAGFLGAVEDAVFGDPAAFLDFLAGCVGPAREGFTVEEIDPSVFSLGD